MRLFHALGVFMNGCLALGLAVMAAFAQADQVPDNPITAIRVGQDQKKAVKVNEAIFQAIGFGNTFLVTIANSLFSTATTSGLFGPTSANAGSFYGKVTVAYNYLLVPVPEAGTAFWGMCLGVFAATRRTRTRRS